MMWVLFLLEKDVIVINKLTEKRIEELKSMFDVTAKSMKIMGEAMMYLGKAVIENKGRKENET